MTRNEEILKEHGVETFDEYNPLFEKIKKAMGISNKEVCEGYWKWRNNHELEKLRREQPFQTLIPIPTDEKFYELYLLSINK